jgi:ribosomal protein S18 acetylase RimI-like enzyme
MTYSFRPAEADDVDFLWEMLFHASYAADDGMRDVDALRHHPVLPRYVDGWGRRTDFGVVAEDAGTGERVGAAWIRLLTRDATGYGYIADDTPELAIAVVQAHRGRGVGERLLVELLDAARGTFGAVSLSVRTDNPARRLYERTGFRAVSVRNAGEPDRSASLTMKIDLTT